MGVIHNESAIDKLRELIIAQNAQMATQGTTLEGVTAKVDGLNPNTKTLVLASSTDASTKQFAVTVNDSGTLTATEIVEDSGGES